MWPKINKKLLIILPIALILLLLTSFLLAGCYGVNPRGWAGPVVEGNQLYLGTVGGTVISLDLTGQGRNWTTPLQSEASGGLGCGFGCTGAAPVAIYGSTALTDNRLYVAVYDGRFFSLYADTGGVAWQYPLGEEKKLGTIAGGPQVVADQGLVLVGSSDTYLYAFDAERRGPPLWSFKTKDKIWSTPVVIGDMVYFSSMDSNVYALKLSREAPTLVQTYPTVGTVVASPLVTEDTLYIGSFDRKFYAFDLTTAQVKGTFETEGGYWSQPLLHGGYLYVGSLDGNVYRLNASDVTQGQVVVKTEGPIRADPVMAAGKVVFASRDGNIYIIDPESLSVDTVAIGAPVLSPLAAKDNLVYAYSETGNIYEVDAALKSWRIIFSPEK